MANTSDVEVENVTANNTEAPNPVGMYSPLAAAAITISALLLIVIIAVGNFLVVAAVLRERKLRRLRQNWLIVSLAMADALVGIIVMPMTLAYEIVGEWKLGWILCELWLALDVLFVTSSILNLAAISLDRYLSLTSPMEYPKKRTPGRMGSAIAAVWILSALISFPPLLGWHPERKEQGHCTLSNDFAYVMYSALGSFYVPVAVIVVVYVRIFSIIRERSKARMREAKRRQATLTLSTVLSPIAKNKSRSKASALDWPKPPIRNHRSASSPLKMDEQATELLLRQCGNGTTAPPPPPARRLFARRGVLVQTTSPRTSVGIQMDLQATSSMIEETEPTKKLSDANSAGSPTIHLGPPTPISHRGSIAGADGTAYVQSRADQSRNSLQAPSQGSPGRTPLPSKKSSASMYGDYEPEMSKVLANSAQAGVERKKKLLKKQDRKATLSLSLILGSFIACWLPFFILYLLSSFGIVAPELLFDLCFWLGYCNSALNPVIYALLNKDFRNAFRKILSCNRRW